MSNSFVRYLLEGNNYPSNGQVVFDSSDHIRFQNGQDISGHNYGCNRRLVIKKNIQVCPKHILQTKFLQICHIAITIYWQWPIFHLDYTQKKSKKTE